MYVFNVILLADILFVYYNSYHATSFSRNLQVIFSHFHRHYREYHSKRSSYVGNSQNRCRYGASEHNFFLNAENGVLIFFNI